MSRPSVSSSFAGCSLPEPRCFDPTCAHQSIRAVSPDTQGKRLADRRDVHLSHGLVSTWEGHRKDIARAAAPGWATA